MRRTYLEIVLEHVGKSQAQASRRLGWSTGRVGYLCSPECKGFPFGELWYLKTALNLSDTEQIHILDEYFRQFATGTGSGNSAGNGTVGETRNVSGIRHDRI